MEPSLRDGDIVLVRKFDLFPFINYRDDLPPPDVPEDTRDSNLEETMVSYHLWHMQQINNLYGRNNPTFSFRSFWNSSSSPLSFSYSINPLPGSVIIFSSPIDFPIKLSMKRVLAQEGQRVRPSSTNNRYRSTILHVPENSLWVEGDNKKDSEDSSSNYGPISKKLIVGTVDRIIWPPSRIGKVKRIDPPFHRSWW